MSKVKVLDAPIKIRVSCGGSSATVKAHSFAEAFGMFLDKKNPKALGVICEFKTKEWEPGEDTFYMDTVRTLKELGRYE